MQSAPEDKGRPGRIMMLATIFLICLVLILNQIATRTLTTPSREDQQAGTADSIEERFGAGLSWQMGMAVSGKDFQVSLKDEEGRPVRKGTVQLVILNDEKEKVLEYRLEETEPGLYASPMPDLKHGRFQAHIEAVSTQGRMLRRFMIQF